MNNRAKATVSDGAFGESARRSPTNSGAEAAKWIALAVLIGLFVLAISGCASDLSRYEASPTGHAILVMEGVECPRAIIRHPNGGCATGLPVYVEFFPVGDKVAAREERGHTNGMTHGPWKPMGNRNCTTVINAGWSDFKAGELICR